MFKDGDTVTNDVNTTDFSPAKDAGTIADNEDMSAETFEAERMDVFESVETMPPDIPAYLEDTLKESPLIAPELSEEQTAEPTQEVIEAAPVTYPEVVPPPASLISVCSQTNGRANNEDSYFVQLLPTLPGASPVLLLALSDGMGGHDFGELASRESLRKLALLLFEQYAILPQLNGKGVAPTAEAVGQAMVQAMPLVSAHVQRIAEINGWNRSGATLVCGAIIGDTAVFVNVGDSPAYHVRVSEGRVSHMSDDHSLAGMLLKANLITPEMARVHEGRCQLEHYIGGPNLPNEMPVHNVTLAPGDYILLCSDGVSNSLSDTDILHMLAGQDSTLTDRAASFVVHARQTGEQDNQTIVLYQQGIEGHLAGIEVIPDAGAISPYSEDFADNVPASQTVMPLIEEKA